MAESLNLLIFVLSILFSFIIGAYFGRKKYQDGLFIIDDSDNEDIRWILDMSIDPKTIPTKKTILLKVKQAKAGDV